MNVEDFIELIANPYNEAKLSIMHSSSGFDGFSRFYNNFLSKCSDFSEIELLLKVDSHKDMNLYENLLVDNNIKYKFIVYPVFNLRHSMHLFWNDLSRVSSTNLLWAVGEDIKIKHGDWLNEVLELDVRLKDKYKDGIYCIGINQETEDNEPIRIGRMQVATKKWIDAIGCFSPYPNIDRWLYNLSDDVRRKDTIDKSKLLLFYPRGSRTMSKVVKKQLLKPSVKLAVKKLKEAIRRYDGR